MVNACLCGGGRGRGGVVVEKSGGRRREAERDDRECKGGRVREVVVVGSSTHDERT